MIPFFKISGITALIAFPAISLAAQLEVTAVNKLSLARADAADVGTCWAGFCWDKAAWTAHVAEFAKGLASPIEIKTTLSN